MENIIDKQWLCVHNWVYVSILTDVVLLYNTKNGQYILTKNPKHLLLVNQLQARQNLGAIIIENCLLQSAEYKNFIEEAQQKNIFSLIKYIENQPKPIQLMPILNIQRDVHKLKKDIDRSLGEEIIFYLTELNLFVNNKCSLKCDFCENAVKQFSCCTAKNNKTNLVFSILQSIAKQVKILTGVRINILGGNIFQYPDLIKIQTVFPVKNIHYWFYYSNFKPYIMNSNSYFEVLIDLPVKKDILTELIKILPKETTKFHFIVSSIENVESAQYVIKELSIDNFEFHPFYDGENIDFFEKNVFLHQDDITSDIIFQRKIFCNQALNTNFFGKLTILPNGEVFANLNTVNLGNIKDKSILQLIYKELDTNTVWRKTRIQKPCSECIYQYLCPPLSNYEFVIGKSNLCHVNQ